MNTHFKIILFTKLCYFDDQKLHHFIHFFRIVRYGDKNGCIMDFGATYTCESNERMVNTIWGIAGFMQNYHQCGTLTYNMFTSVANFRCWIDKTLQANGVDNSTNANPFTC